MKLTCNLRALGIRPKTIARDDGDGLRVPVTTTDAGETVYAAVARAELPAWCERRLETRMQHKNCALRWSGGVANYTLRTIG